MFKRLVAIISFFIAVFLWQTSWLTAPRSWEVASGLDQVPEIGKRFYTADRSPKISWLGHSGFLIQWNNVNILLDPNLSETCSIVHREARSFTTPGMLPKIDAALISHTHYDHLDLPTLVGIQNLNKIVLASGSEVFLSKSLLSKSHGVKVWENFELANGIKITAVPAVHNGARNHPFSSVYKALGYVISDGIDTIYFAGDTGWGGHFEKIKQKFSPNIAILPIGGFEPYFILKNYHLNPEDATKAAKIIDAKVIIPAHFGTFRVALESTDFALPRFISACKDLKIDCQLAKPYGF